ncbi:MAG: glycosyltransferase family 2 protein [Methanosarcinales archaeon]|nr:glycosyltransferase family 2 protein [Methanosarcinales archaeon]
MNDKNKPVLISIIIPAYNEEKRIAKTLSELFDFFCDISHEILVLMDGCTDSTPDIVADFAEDHPSVISIYRPTKLGKGGAILLGISKAQGKVITVVDADGAVPPHDVKKMTDMIIEGSHCVISSRYLPGSVIHTSQPGHRIILSRCFNVLVRLLFGLSFKDTQCGCKVARSEVFHEVADEIQTYNYAFDVELLWRIKEHGYIIEEVPVEWRHIEGSKLDLKKVVPEMLTAVINIRLKK